jgi:hypothetical protein
MTNQSSDLVIREKIENELSGPHLWDTTDIHPDVSDGVVTLTGTVADKEASHKSAALVATIEGVTRVNNQLQIKGGGLAAALSEIAAEVSKVTTDDQHEHKKDEQSKG